MRDPKSVKTHRSYDTDFKQEMTRMLASGRSFEKISEIFGIAENVLCRWRRKATKKTKSNSGVDSNDKAAKLAAEVAKLQAENEWLKSDREILKKARRVTPLSLLSQSDSGTSMC